MISWVVVVIKVVIFGPSFIGKQYSFLIEISNMRALLNIGCLLGHWPEYRY